MLSFSKWWNEGDAPGAVVYRDAWRTPLAVAAIFGLFYFFVPPFRVWYVEAIFALGFARSLTERRRALIFSGAEVTVRPALGATRAVPLGDVLAVRPCSTVTFFFLAPRWVNGVEIELRSGHRFRVPLDFPRAGEISGRLYSLARSQDASAPASRTPRTRGSEPPLQ